MAGPGNGGLLKAIFEHHSKNLSCASGQVFTSDGVACESEANDVIEQFNGLSASQKQDILNLLRSLYEPPRRAARCRTPWQACPREERVLRVPIEQCVV